MLCDDLTRDQRRQGPKHTGVSSSLDGWRNQTSRSRQLCARPLEEREDKCRCVPECDSEDATPRTQGLNVTKASAARPAPRAPEFVSLCAGERQ